MSRFGTSAARMSPNLCRQWISLELSRTPHHIQAPIQAIQGHHCASKVLFNAQFQGFINTLRNQSSAPIKGITSPSEALQKDGNEGWDPSFHFCSSACGFFQSPATHQKENHQNSLTEFCFHFPQDWRVEDDRFLLLSRRRSRGQSNRENHGVPHHEIEKGESAPAI
ncbi:uncharacterized protein LOC132200474 isoform X1 [Neocloeon triangulifer]|uniref:uncharacterized protein LOC132200474 isoform X1 n=1 Tax=Neocloeon triangulifer TaxID=2078957 RepID=UPI00286F6048|nr:uncharacterized protein LOC132200474 isoform X1 [Neocloeon triangulifer]